jgi:hypothetical protein
MYTCDRQHKKENLEQFDILVWFYKALKRDILRLDSLAKEEQDREWWEEEVKFLKNIEVEW